MEMKLRTRVVRQLMSSTWFSNQAGRGYNELLKNAQQTFSYNDNAYLSIPNNMNNSSEL